MKDAILVTGGNGFLGRQICSLLSRRGIPVISIARSGQPAGINPDDYTTVSWVTADVFDLPSWQHHLEHCRAVIHCIGIITEVPDEQITYERINFQAAKLVGDAVKERGIPTLVYISAAAGAPDTPEGYMTHKLGAETYLNELGIGTVILKPGLMYGTDKPETIEEHKAILELMQDPRLAPVIRPVRPLPVETVARVAVAAALHYIRENVLDVNGIEEANMLLNTEF